MKTWLVLGLALIGCGGAESAGGDAAASSASSSGAGGGGGQGGGGGGPGAKPACATQGGPTGPVPDPRADTAGAMSNDGQTVVVFGGDVAIPVCGQIPTREHVGDTWLLDAACGGWTELTPSPAPGARARHAMTVDPASGRALLFGGRTRMGDTGPYTQLGDLWAFDFDAKTWTEIATTGTGPSPRSNAAIAVVGKELVVFGGNTSTSGTTFTPQSDAFALDLETDAWRSIAAASPPAARLFHAGASMQGDGRMFVYSGGDANAFTGPFLRDAWQLDVASATWTEIAGDAESIGRIKLGMLARPASGDAAAALVAFGGHDDGTLGNRNDVVSMPLEGGAFATVVAGDVYAHAATGQCDFPPDFVTTDMASPERRSSFAFAARADGEAAVVFAGDSDCGRLSDAWWLDAVAATWTPVRSTLPGLTCPRTGNPDCTALCQ